MNNSSVTTHKLYAKMALDSYKDNSYNPNYARISKYNIHNDDNGFDGCVFTYGDDTVVVAYRGTDDKNVFTGDVANDIQLYFNSIPNQYKDALELYKSVKNDPMFSGKKIVLAGHSLGGSLAQLVASTDSVEIEEAVTFNAYGTKKIIDEKDDNIYERHNTTNYYITGDLVATNEKNPGVSVIFNEGCPEDDNHRLCLYTNADNSLWTSASGRALAQKRNDLNGKNIFMAANP